jgi:23S rRNA (guanosine2251-2'-O)-methyltransferase
LSRRAADIGGERVEGRQAVRELLRARRRSVRRVLVSDPDSVADIVDLAASAGVSLRRVSNDELRSLARTEAPQGVVAEASPVRPFDLEELLAQRPGKPPPFLVVLDGVTDPGNLGAIMRSALGAGASGLVLARHRAVKLTPAAVKAAAGAVEHLPIAGVGGIPAALVTMSDAGLWTVGLDAGADSPIWGLNVADQPLALVVGAEGRGLSPLVRRRCQVLAAIPQAGPLDSLNVSVAAAVGCFEIARLRQG